MFKSKHQLGKYTNFKVNKQQQKIKKKPSTWSDGDQEPAKMIQYKVLILIYT